MSQEDCKHENQTGKFCNLCGKQLVDDTQEFVNRVADEVVKRLKPEKKTDDKKDDADDDKPLTELDRFLGRKKGKK